MQTGRYPVVHPGKYLWKTFVNLGVSQTKLDPQYSIDEMAEEIIAIEKLRTKLSKTEA